MWLLQTGTIGGHQSRLQNGIFEPDVLPTRPLALPQALLAVRNAGSFHLGSTPQQPFWTKQVLGKCFLEGRMSE